MKGEISTEYLIQAAKEVYSDVKMQKVAVTQAVHESGTLSNRGPSELALLHKNLFGIKGSGTAGSAMMPTWEHINGKDVKVKAAFAKNHTYSDSFNQHKRLMNFRRYKPVLDAIDEFEAFEQLQKCGYATDPKYPAKLKFVYSSNIAKYFD